MPLRAVLFDLGDTLWHFPELPPVDTIRKETVQRISELLRSWDIEPEGERFFLGRDIRLALNEVEGAAYRGDLVSPNYTTLVQNVAASKGLDLSPEQSEQLWDTWNLGGAFLGRILFDDTIDMLETLRNQGYRLGCITNRSFGGPRFLEEVRELGILDFFEVMAISCDFGYMKPHPQIYEHALSTMKIAPDETAMVGDSLRADMEGAQALGITAIWRTRPNPREEIDGVVPDFTVDELREIPRLPCFTAD